MKLAVLSSVGGTIDAFFPPIIDRWREHGLEVVTAAGTSSHRDEHSVLSGITRRPNILNIRAPHSIKKWLEREQADVLITNTAVASMLARMIDMPVPVIYFCHGLHWNDLTTRSERVWQQVESRALARTTGVITINADDEGWFSDRLPAERIMRLGAGVGLPLDIYPHAPSPANENIYRLLWAGELSDRKRPIDAVDVIVELLRTNSSVHLTICGTGELYEETREYIANHNLESAISIVGRVSDIGERLAASHALLMTSRWEGLPRIGLEAIAVGRPVFAYDVKGVRSLPSVHLSRNSDPVGLAQDIRRFIAKDPADVGAEFRRKLDARYAADQIAQFAERIVAYRKKC